MSKRMKALLIISLAFNLLVVGLVAGRFLGFGKHGHHYGPYGYIMYMAPAEKRDQIKTILEKHKTGFRGHRRMRREAWRSFSKILKQETFDKQAFLAEFDKTITKRNERWRHHADTIIEIADVLTPAERIAIVEKIDKKFTRRRWFKRRYRNNDAPPQSQ